MLEGVADLVSLARRDPRGRAGEHQGELVTPDTGEEVLAANHVLTGVYQGHQHPVADGMAVGVVDALEVVEVEHHHRKLVPAPALTVQEALQEPVKGTPVVNTGEAVAARFILRPLEFAAQHLHLALQGFQAAGIGLPLAFQRTAQGGEFAHESRLDATDIFEPGEARHGVDLLACARIVGLVARVHRDEGTGQGADDVAELFVPLLQIVMLASDESGNEPHPLAHLPGRWRAVPRRAQQRPQVFQLTIEGRGIEVGFMQREGLEPVERVVVQFAMEALARRQPFELFRRARPGVGAAVVG